jgi:SpoVK/Ycf46/Vps4 family AAA+-type ATPase
MEKLINHLRAGFSCFWLRTNEPNRVKAEVYKSLTDFQLANGESFKPVEWDCVIDRDPISPLTTLLSSEQNTVMFVYNYHWNIDKPMIIQTILNNLVEWSNAGKAIVVVSPVEKIPVELKKNFTSLKLSLPNDTEITTTIEHVAPSTDFIPAKAKHAQVVKAAKGLTRLEMENVFALSLVEHKEFDVQTINDYKAASIGSSGFVEVLKPTLTFKDVIGYETIKAQVMDTIHKPTAKGIISIGPPGCGKTSLAKAIVAESGKFGIQIRMGKMFSKYQGETEANIESTIELIYTLGDCFVLFDEFEKQFAGAGGSGDLDSGVTKRATSRWLDFLQDRPPNIYVAATCNSFQGIPGPYLRVGRWDCGPFMIDLPTEKVKAKILDYYIDKFNLSKAVCKTVPKMDQWTGAEIEGLCHNADMRGIDLMQASKFILPQALTMQEEISALREWAKGRTIPAEEVPAVVKSPTKKRKIEM